MPEIHSHGIAVYVYCRTPQFAFLQLRRVADQSFAQSTWQTVYGSVESGETAVQAAVRELREETGFSSASMWQVEFIEQFYSRGEDCLNLMPVFAVEVPNNAQPVLNREHDAFRWVPEPQVGRTFMWRTQRDAIAVILETLRNPSAAMEFLRIPPE